MIHSADNEKVRKRLFWLIISLALLSFASAFFLIWFYEFFEREIGKEPYKLLLQFCLIVILGSLVGFLTKESSRFRENAVEESRIKIEKKDALREARKTYYNSLLESYANMKSARRMIRAKAREFLNGEKPGGVPYIILNQVYDEQMQLLNNVQLNFELHHRRLDGTPELVPGAEEFKKNLVSVGDYLKNIVHEYENQAIHVQSCDFVKRSPKEMPALSEFIKPANKESAFQKNCQEPFWVILGMLGKSISSGPC